MSFTAQSLPVSGFGLGLRAAHYPYLFQHLPDVDWFEIISENFMDTEGRPRRNLSKIAAHYPLVMHGVSLAIGNSDPLNQNYLKQLKQLKTDIQPLWISDHLCWTGNAHANTHDLLPMPYTEESLLHVVQRIQAVQDFLGERIALENPSTYLEFKSSSIPEAEFIERMTEEADCLLLLDINNVYVSCYNHGLDVKHYLDTLPLERVVQIHLSGHRNYKSHIIDTHDQLIIDDVWNMYQYIVQQAKRIPNTMIEWDGNIPEFSVLYSELSKAKHYAATAEKEQAITLPDLCPHHQSKTITLSSSVSSLRAEQESMLAAILPPASAALPPENWIHAKPHFSASEQLGIYQYAYGARLHEVVSEDYPVLKRYLGDDIFQTLMTQFVESYSSKHFNIGRFAQKLPIFLKQTLNDTFAYELCVLETELSQLADVKETDPLTSQDLIGCTPEFLSEMVLYPRSALALLQFSHAVNAYYCAVQNESPDPTVLEYPSFLAVFRHNDAMWRLDLDNDEYSVLTGLFSGQSIGQVLEEMHTNVSEDASEVSTQIYQWFSRWMQHGLFAQTAPSHSLTF